jgi:hypothetical protein
MTHLSLLMRDPSSLPGSPDASKPKFFAPKTTMSLDEVAPDRVNLAESRRDACIINPHDRVPDREQSLLHSDSCRPMVAMQRQELARCWTHFECEVRHATAFLRYGYIQYGRGLRNGEFP